MIALIQRVLNASVTVGGETVGKIGPGLLVLLGVEQGDNEQKAQRLCERVLGYRIFGDENDKMNLNVQQAGGSVLVVSQFTLAADTQKGMRPSFARRRTFGRRSVVSIFCWPVPRTRRRDPDRRIRRRHAGGAGQRWPGDILATGLSI